MYGYVRPLTGELKVREQQMYKAVYCGLCHSIGRHTGQLSRLALSYDLVFLCTFRAAIERIPFSVKKQVCVLHPLHSRPTIQENPALAFGAAVSALLANIKVSDDLSDEKGLRRFAAASVVPFTCYALRRASEYRELSDTINRILSRLSNLEKEGCSSPDETSLCFGSTLEEIFSFGLNGTNERIARTIGRATGQFVYLTDAIDDAEKDLKQKRYNPIMRCWGNEALIEKHLSFHEKGPEDESPSRHRMILREDIAEKIYIALCSILKNGASAAELIDYTGTAPEAEGIVKNTLYLGMPAIARKVLYLPRSTESMT